MADISCDRNDLVANAKCYCYGDHRMDAAITIYLLATIAGDTSTPAELARKAACYCFPDQRSRDAVMLYLLCAIADAAGA